MIIVWFRQDLRIFDNPALEFACSMGKILPIYIFDDTNEKQNPMGSASKVWLHYSLINLKKAIKELSFFKGEPKKIILKICKKYDINGVFWNRCYDPFSIKRDKSINEYLMSIGIDVKGFNGSLLWEPWEVTKNDGSPYKVFTPFYQKGCLQKDPPRKPINAPKNINAVQVDFGISIDDLNLLPTHKWTRNIIKAHNIGEQSALKKLNTFVKQGLFDYKNGRNYPSKKHVSRLSPHLHFGEISPNAIWWKVKNLDSTDDQKCFLSELGWREFSYNLLYFNPDIKNTNINKKFNKFPWGSNKKLLVAWQNGKTGIPIVDAGMRELWQTGYMHNRVRMIVGSFLVKNLLIHWTEGEKWFWDCLVDADCANNSASWQWIAGCGADASPYFRIFNPVLQGQKFDPNGSYTLKYIPELKNLNKKYLFNPWEAPKEVLEIAGIKLGIDYPNNIIDIKKSRQYAIDTYMTFKK
jgi:deoxyribodipyrimidine photo-lyase